MSITYSHFKSYTNFFGNNNHILLIITPIYAQNNDDDFEYGIIFPNFEGEDSSGGIDGGRNDDSDGSSGGSSNSGSGSSMIDDDDNGKGEGENEELINENTNDFSPLSSNSSTINDKANPDEGIGQYEAKQIEQEDEGALQVDQQIDESLNQSVGNGVNQTVEQQGIGQQSEQQAFE